MQTVEEIFAPFGQEVINEVHRQVAHYGSLVPLLRRLNVPAVGNRINEHKALREFIYKYGVFLFLKASRENLPADEVERLKVQKLLGYGGTTGPRPNMASLTKPADSPHQTPPAQPVKAVQPLKANGGLAPTPPARQNAVASPASHASGSGRAVPKTGVSRRYTGEIKEQVRPPARKRIMTSTYYGPDRRSAERRKRNGTGISEERRARGRRSTDQQ